MESVYPSHLYDCLTISFVPKRKEHGSQEGSAKRGSRGSEFQVKERETLPSGGEREPMEANVAAGDRGQMPHHGCIGFGEIQATFWIRCRQKLLMNFMGEER